MDETDERTPTKHNFTNICRVTENNSPLQLSGHEETKCRNYILSGSGNPALSRCMKDDGEPLSLPIDSDGSMTGAIKDDTKKRGPEIRIIHGNPMIKERLHQLHKEDPNDKIARVSSLTHDRISYLDIISQFDSRFYNNSSEELSTNNNSGNNESLTKDNTINPISGSPAFPQYLSDTTTRQLLERMQQQTTTSYLNDEEFRQSEAVFAIDDTHIKNYPVKPNTPEYTEKQVEVIENAYVTEKRQSPNKFICNDEIQSGRSYQQISTHMKTRHACDDINYRTSSYLSKDLPEKEPQFKMVESDCLERSETETESNSLIIFNRVADTTIRESSYKDAMNTKHQQDNATINEDVMYSERFNSNETVIPRVLHNWQTSRSSNQNGMERAREQFVENSNILKYQRAEFSEDQRYGQIEFEFSAHTGPNTNFMNNRTAECSEWIEEKSERVFGNEFNRNKHQQNNSEKQKAHVTLTQSRMVTSYTPDLEPSSNEKGQLYGELGRTDSQRRFVSDHKNPNSNRIPRRSIETNESTRNSLPEEIQEDTDFYRSPIEMAYHNQISSKCSQLYSKETSHESQMMLNRTRRIPPSPLILRSNYEEDERPCKSPRLNGPQTSNSSILPLGGNEREEFTLQDPPRKFKRQLSKEENMKQTAPTVEVNDAVTEVKELGTPKRLRPSVHETVCQSPHIRTSSVIRTPKGKEENVFVFPERTPTSKQLEYKFNVGTDSYDLNTTKSIIRQNKSFYPQESSVSNHVPKMSPNQDFYRSPMSTPKRGYNNYDSSKGFLWTQKPTERCLYFQTQSSPEKPRPLRSQSNIEEQSPSKLSKQELDSIRYLRSVSLPANEFDQRFSSRRPYYRVDPFEDVFSGGARSNRPCGTHWIEPGVRRELDFDHLRNLPERESRRLPRTMLGMIPFAEEDERRHIFSHNHTSLCTGDSAVHGGDSTRRRSGHMNLRIHCSGIARECEDIVSRLQALDHSSRNDCECKRIESDVLELAKGAYSMIPRPCYSQEEQRQMEEELNETNVRVLEAIKIAVRFRELCKHGRSINNIYNGSVIIRLNCLTLGSVENLWMKYKSGELQTLINNIFITPNLLEKYSAKMILLSVSLDEKEYQRCKDELVSGLIKRPVSTPDPKRSPYKRSPDKRTTKSAEDLLHMPVSPKHELRKPRCSSTPSLSNFSPLGSPSENYSPSSAKRERKFSFGDQSRRAFQDLNSPRSPGRRFNLEDIRQIVESPLYDFSNSDDDDDQENVNISFQTRGSISRHSSPYSPLVPPKSPLNCSPLSPRYSPR